MDYKGSSFQTKWKDGLLKIRAIKIEANTFSLLDIILDAAVKKGGFNIAWDLRQLEALTAYQTFQTLNFIRQWKERLDTHVHKCSILTSPNKEYILKYIFKLIPPSCPYYLGADLYEAKNFVTPNLTRH